MKEPEGLLQTSRGVAIHGGTLLEEYQVRAPFGACQGLSDPRS